VKTLSGPEAHAAFEDFARAVEPGLRRALVGYYGFDLGAEATAEALAWAWATWPRCAEVANPVAYLFRVGQSRSRRFRRRSIFGQFPRAEVVAPRFEPGLGPALEALSRQQRVAVVLHVGYAWTLEEIAELLSVSRSTVQRNLDRGIRSLRSALGAGDSEQRQYR
jgi:RNA polymerase sigma factor (sigma-70 family)